MPPNAKSIESGITEATINDARTLRRNRKSTAMTSSPPSIRFLASCCGARNQLGLVVERRDLHVRRQALADLVQPRAHIADHAAGVGALELEHHPADDFALAVLRDRALPRERAHLDVGHVAHEHRHPAAHGDDHLPDLGERLGPPHAAQGEALAAVST
jgi:hypothetical protein